jgi:hypothetical protein
MILPIRAKRFDKIRNGKMRFSIEVKAKHAILQVNQVGSPGRIRTSDPTVNSHPRPVASISGGSKRYRKYLTFRGLRVDAYRDHFIPFVMEVGHKFGHKGESMLFRT